ncbi:helix-turn-helix domain-containing protein [Streptomyces sp. NPDC057620]|uniref:helix-turn-helix domain-containing protein n=1 Tax=Streptomyces sp. NPDC057620 TaxID=3346185 RepID=UPI00368188E3
MPPPRRPAKRWGPSAFDEDQVADIVKAYDKGTAVKALAREYDVSPKTIRRALDSADTRSVPANLDKPLEDVASERQEPEPDPERTVVLDIPGLLADHLRHTENGQIRVTLDTDRPIRRGQGYSVCVTAPFTVHEAILQACASPTEETGTPAGRKARRVHSERIALSRAQNRADYARPSVASLTAPSLPASEVIRRGHQDPARVRVRQR